MKYCAATLRAALLGILLLAPGAHAGALWIDVRSPEEHAADAIPGDPNIEYTGIGEHIEELAPDRNAEIVLYCGSGMRSEIARMQLRRLGYTNVRNAGGIDDARSERGL